MLQLGITGGIGSGKTTVCKLFEQLHAPIYYADDRAKWLMQHDEQLVADLREAFGTETFTADGKLNRTYLANIVFHNTDQLNKLNALVHPVVQRDSEEWFRAQKYKNTPYALKEAALLYESGSYQSLDKIIVVTAPLEQRIERVMQRDNTTRAAVLARINKQMPQEDKERMADFIITNNDMDSLESQVQKLHELLLKLASRKLA